MRIEYAKPTERGVTQLMYVGDDGLPAATPTRRPGLVIAAAGVLAAILAQDKKTKFVRGQKQIGLVALILGGSMVLFSPL